ncbi:methylated-DNA--cysteine S-met [Rhodocollybia butyracea]|uniref:Methylated-DNA--protein-cysteine methyltransferase n=1 Tax=Rhodocollybia butyracea TaxID=206335 RepID=A0A9P5PYZ4_9AGAR|nr:methylated-DNA--cysteine S-met [Rhodocollybia butyracea]
MPAVRSSSTSSILKNKQIFYPTSKAERDAFRRLSGKGVTQHQWDVYDFTKSIPKGQVVRYADVCRVVGGSPRSVGNALRNNPFAPYIPCHRVIASTLYIGGFLGEWGPESKTKIQCRRKLEILKDEGVMFTEKGYLEKKETLWQMHN